MVPVDERGLGGPDEFDGDVERNRNDVLERDESVEERDQRVEARVVVRLIGKQLPVRLLIVPSFLVGVVDDATYDGDNGEEGQVEQDLRVHLPLDLGPLGRCATRVENDLGVSTGEEHDTDDPASVLQDATSQDGRLEGDRVDQGRLVRLLSVLVGQNDRSVELVHVDISRFGVDAETSLFQSGGSAKVRQFRDTVSGLQVGLSIQVLGLDETDVFLLGSAA
jgi:hypothetical protein